MDLNWSLKEIYPSFESEEFKNDIKKLDEIIIDINNLLNQLLSLFAFFLRIIFL